MISLSSNTLSSVLEAYLADSIFLIAWFSHLFDLHRNSINVLKTEMFLATLRGDFSFLTLSNFIQPFLLNLSILL